MEYLGVPTRPASGERCDEVLVALRRIVRAIDLHSRKLVQNYGVTAPQALILKKLVELEGVSVGELAKHVSLSQATVTDILDRLERRGLVHRMRSVSDRRRVVVKATPQGIDVSLSAPSLLQEGFVREFSLLQDWEQSLIISSLQRVAAMMDAEALEAAQVLSPESSTSVSNSAAAAPEHPAGLHREKP
jgi:DNA-binding MarR family transcriptional regulator